MLSQVSRFRNYLIANVDPDIILLLIKLLVLGHVVSQIVNQHDIAVANVEARARANNLTFSD